ncbi:MULTISPECIES: DNA polymerase III subunit epsilon [unclassified Beijerinckia]|uniref:DNA polymerase III subunit epsilon n=1 Tax=unclassified Beijerinckia TaxID=2638183 RepID=UPI000B82F5DD|nr:MULTISPECIES: DNA polymerase III subunit epsilon [unclassified Beijerinckia]
MREIVLDTETTGLDPNSGDRLVEIGCVELINLIPSGQTFHVYLDPERDMPEEAFRIHGLSAEFLKGKPKFADVADQFIEFIAGDQLIIHNAEFDIKFLNAELGRTQRTLLKMDRVTNTLALARRKHPGASNSLDALCSRYRIDNSRRTKHGALLDSEILAEVYAELLGGRQSHFVLAESQSTAVDQVVGDFLKKRETALAPTVSVEELAAHSKLLEKLGEKAIWQRYF